MEPDDHFALAPGSAPPATRRRKRVVAGLAVVGMLAGGALGYRALSGPSPSPSSVAVDNAAQPSVVLILTDDQRWDTLWAMPIVKRDLVDHGITFNDAFVVNSACCPSRASILTGAYSHSTHVYTDTGSRGGFGSFNDGSTVATWLGPEYTSALIGKYLNGYERAGSNGKVPLGWDRWIAFPRARYFDYSLNIDGGITQRGSTGADYSTDVLTDYAVDFIRDTEGPIFLYFSPKAPHYPAIPEAQDREAFSDLPPWRPASFNEAEVSDKPAWLSRKPPLTAQEIRLLDAFRLDQLRTLRSVDRAVGQIVEALRQTGRLGSTLIVFMSVIGMLWG